MKLEPGLYPNLPYEEYDRIDAYRYSDLKALDRSPLLYKHRRENPIKQTDPMKIGNAAHLAILEPAKARFAIWQGPGIRSGNAYKDWCAANAGHTQLNIKEADYVFGISRAVHANPVAHKYLSKGRRELTLVWFDTTWNRFFKARIDNAIESGDEHTLVSLKTTSDCHERMFAMQYVKMGYHCQDAIYQAGWWHVTGRLPRMITVAVDSTAPHESAVYEIGSEWLLEGQAAVTRWCKSLDVCEQTGTWPVAYENERELEMPGWAVTLNEFSMDDLEAIES